MHRLLSLLARFRSDERGAFLAIFAVAGIVLIAMSGAVVDYVSVEQARTRAQVAIDAATLAIQPLMYATPTKSDADLAKLAKDILIERLGADEGWTLCDSGKKLPCAGDISAVTDRTLGIITIKATLDVPLYFVALVGVNHMKASVLSEVTRGSSDIEVSLALDTTGSMAGQPIIDLRAATQDLIDIVVKDVQTPTYSKVAIVPYSMGVNVGAYAASVRGVPKAATPITAAAWASTTKTITAATRANPVVITSNGHGFVNGDRVYISGVGGMSQINNTIFTVSNVATNKFSLSGINGSSFTAYTSGGTAKRCYTTTCEVVVTSAAHGLANGESVYITGVNGMTEINKAQPDVFTVAGVTANTFVLSGVVGTGFNAYTSGGTAYCVKYGCADLYRFQTASGNWRMLDISTCVSERVGANAYTDEPPTTAAVGLNYPTSGNGACLTSTILPLTTDKVALKDVATKLQASGFTSGHIGLAWGWYMLSPKFAYLWPAASRPAPYKTPNLLKVLVLMTDGEFNTAYCNGVISKDSSGATTSDRINCNAPNGGSDDQAIEQCKAIKAAGVILYTVGFNVGNSSAAKTLLTDCATDSDHVYFAESGASLKDAFKEIGANIAALHVSK